MIIIDKEMGEKCTSKLVASCYISANRTKVAHLSFIQGLYNITNSLATDWSLLIRIHNCASSILCSYYKLSILFCYRFIFAKFDNK
jgi:hypothetical protein